MNIIETLEGISWSLHSDGIWSKPVSEAMAKIEAIAEVLQDEDCDGYTEFNLDL